jgi:hypothetical protein
MNWLARLVDWANGPSLDQQLEAECKRLQLNLETADAHLINLRAKNEQLREILRGPAPGTVELTIRAFNEAGEPISTRYQMHTRHIVADRDEIAAFLANRCRHLYLSLVANSE